ncbi:MAG TPA: hypothetical protein VEG66_01490 [Thermoplasmata archaeon]|jgi:hypothetical protein|nr:hypothetical protein [Thermoplasmata archaeon]
MRNPRAKIGVLMLLLGWMVFVFAIVPFVYGIGQFRVISLALALLGAVMMTLGGLWVWKGGAPREPPP